MSIIGTPSMTKKSGSKPEEWSRKKIIMQLRGSEEYKAWLEKLAEADATSVAEMAERAFAEYARKIAFADPRPRR